MNFKTQEITRREPLGRTKRIIIKSPLIPLLPVFDRKKITKGEPISPPFGVFFPVDDGARRGREGFSKRESVTAINILSKW